RRQSSAQSQSKPQSAWMLFIQDRREQVKLDNPDIAVTQQQKIMSEIWKTLSGDEREAYRSRARDDQKRYKAEQADKPTVKKEEFYGNDERGQSTELVCPIGRIGRIIKLDQDVQSVTKEATALIGKAMELFTTLVAKEAFSVSQSQNRRLLKLQDITDIMHNQASLAGSSHLGQMIDQFYWIKDDFPLPTR
ncbi:unnamed protein product, partial [Laminaria digitata]